MANEFLTALQYAFKEQVVPGFQDIMIANDRVFENVVLGNSRIARDPLTREYKIIKTMATSLAGGMEFTGVLGNQTLPASRATADRAVINESFPAFPGVQDSTLPGIARYSVQLTRVRGNIHMPFAALQANELEAVLDDYPALCMKKHIEMVGHTMANSFYADTSAGLVKLNTAVTDVHTNGTHLVVLTGTSVKLIADGRIRRLKPGMYVDIWNSDQSTCYNETGFVVVMGAVGYQNAASGGGATSLRLWFSNTDEADAFAVDTVAESCWLVPRSAISDRTSDGTGLSVLPCGFKQWAINTGTLYGSSFGDMTITDYPELMSIVASSVGDINETVLNAYLALYYDALDGDADTILTESGVLTNILDYPLANNLISYERQGQAADVRMGWKKLTYTYDGREFQLYQSSYMGEGELLFSKLGGGNFQRHFPPRLPGTGTQTGFDSAISWIGPIFGQNIWMPTLNANKVAEGMQAPYILTLQHTVDDPRSLFLSGCSRTTV